MNMRPLERLTQTKMAQPFKRLGDRIAQLKQPSLSEETKAHFRAFDENLERSWRELQEKRAKEPKIPTHMEWEGRMVTHGEYFRLYIAERQRFDQFESYATKRGETYNSHEQVMLYGTLSPEQKNTVDVQLAQEARDARFSDMAQEIQNLMWNNPLHPFLVKIKPAHEVNIGTREDGTILNRSGSGVTISYTHKDREIQTVGEQKREPIARLEESLTFGVRYVTDKRYLAQEVKDVVSDEDLDKGVKSYFVQQTRTIERNGKAEEETTMIAIPLGYAQTEKEEILTFYKYLYDTAKSIAPKAVLPKAKERVKTYRREKRRAA